MSAIFRLHGHLYPLGKAAEPMESGQRVIKNENGDWVKAPSGNKGAGWCRPTVRQLSSGFDIYNSNYDTGLASTFYGRRNPNVGGYLANVGDPIGVAVDGDTVVLDSYDLYSGTVEIDDMLTVGASGLLVKTTDAAEACAKVLRGGNAANGDTIEISSI